MVSFKKENDKYQSRLIAEDAFQRLLKELNLDLGADYCKFISADGNHFKYTFDGTECDLVIEKDGTVYESVDCLPADRYPSVTYWVENMVTKMGEAV